MDFVRLLFQMHVSNTILETPPYTHTITGVEISEIDFSIIDLFDNDTVRSFTDECYRIFRERYPRCLKGSVDADPYVWSAIALNNLVNNVKSHEQEQMQLEDVFVFPNGCCTLKHCSINLFYEIIIEQLLKEKRIINTDEDIKTMYGKEV